MAMCPNCGSPGAYIGFSTVECRNPECQHFMIEEEKVCPCCGRVGHVPGDDNCDYSSGPVPAMIDDSSGNSAT